MKLEKENQRKLRFTFPTIFVLGVSLLLLILVLLGVSTLLAPNSSDPFLNPGRYVVRLADGTYSLEGNSIRIDSVKRTITLFEENHKFTNAEIDALLAYFGYTKENLILFDNPSANKSEWWTDPNVQLVNTDPVSFTVNMNPQTEDEIFDAYTQNNYSEEPVPSKYPGSL